MHSTSPSYRKDLDETRNYNKVQTAATVLAYVEPKTSLAGLPIDDTPKALHIFE